MPPRRRPRKVGLKRMDAAVDNLSPMGFSPDSIRKKVKSLLQVYGGDEAWPVLEEGSYRLIIDSLLEDQENEKELVPKDLSSDTRDGGALVGEQSECAPSSSTPELLLCSGHQDVPQLSLATVTEQAPLCLGGNGNTTSDETCQVPDVVQPKVEIATLMDACMLLAPPGFDPLVHEYVRTTRKPCLGWIGPKDDNDFVLLKPFPVQGYERRKISKSRWDEIA